MSDRNEALRLADGNDKSALAWLPGSDAHKFRKDTAAALRRLTAEQQVLHQWIAVALQALVASDEFENHQPTRVLVETGLLLVGEKCDDLSGRGE